MSCNLNWRTISIFVLVIFSICETTFCQSVAGNTSVIDLRTYGWEPHGQHQAENPIIAVDHASRILVGFTVGARIGLVKRDRPSLDFRIVRFSPEGKLDLSQSLPTNVAGKTAIYLADTDQIIARANDKLQSFEPESGNAKGGTWKLLAPCPSRCYVKESVTRHTLLLYTTDAEPPLTLIRVSQLALQKCGKAHPSAEDSIQNYPQSITDEFAYFSGENGLEPFAYRWPLCDYDHRVDLPLRIGSRWKVLNDGLYVVTEYRYHKDRWGLRAISSNGQIVFQSNLTKHESVGALPIQSSEHGDRIAALIGTIRGAHRALDISGHVTAARIAVYDIQHGSEMASIAVATKHRYVFGFDLSPDGHRLAILEDGVLRVVDLQATGKNVTKSPQ